MAENYEKKNTRQIELGMVLYSDSGVRKHCAAHLGIQRLGGAQHGVVHLTAQHQPEVQTNSVKMI